MTRHLFAECQLVLRILFRQPGFWVPTVLFPAMLYAFVLLLAWTLAVAAAVCSVRLLHRHTRPHGPMFRERTRKR